MVWVLCRILDFWKRPTGIRTVVHAMFASVQGGVRGVRVQSAVGTLRCSGSGRVDLFIDGEGIPDRQSGTQTAGTVLPNPTIGDGTRQEGTPIRAVCDVTIAEQMEWICGFARGGGGTLSSGGGDDAILLELLKGSAGARHACPGSLEFCTFLSRQNTANRAASTYP